MLMFNKLSMELKRANFTWFKKNQKKVLVIYVIFFLSLWQVTTPPNVQMNPTDPGTYVRRAPHSQIVDKFFAK